MTAPTARVEELGPVPGRGDVAGQRWWLEHDGVRVAVGTLGARLLEVHVPDADGSTTDVLAGPAGLDGHGTEGPFPFAGATVGRYANRLAGARVDVDGATHELVANEGPNQLHGGPDGFAFRWWDASDASDEHGPAVRLALRSPDGDQGFPGEVVASVTYRLRSGGELEVVHRASTDAATVVNLTNHAYWDLSGARGEDPDEVGAHDLAVRASRYVAVDDASLPTAVEPVDGTRFDLRRPQPLERVVGQGVVDHCLLLDEPDGRPAAVLRHAASGRRMTLTTDQPGLQVYLGHMLGTPHGALALEPEVPPDAPNRPDLPLGEQRGLLRPGDEYVHTTTFLFDVAGTDA